MAADLQSVLLTKLSTDIIEDSGEFANSVNADHNAVVSVLLSLSSRNIIKQTVKTRSLWQLTEEAQRYLREGSVEFQVFQLVPADGILAKELEAAAVAKKLDPKVGIDKCMANKWLKRNKDRYERQPQYAESIPEDTVCAQLNSVKADPTGAAVGAKLLTILNKRQLVSSVTVKTFRVEQGPRFTTNPAPLVADLTADMIANGEWQTAEFKPFNFNAEGKEPPSGALHPLLKMRTQYREIFLEMGFEEMPTNQYVESSFWNFDALYQPQQHPVRDAHDTFFIASPAETKTIPQDYMQRVKDIHEHGGYGSVGYRYDWKEEEARKNIMRTHTTAISTRMLYKVAQNGFKPCKYFSVDKVFRNEKMDATHLAEFHQVEGLICDKGLTVAHLMGVLTEFFRRIFGVSKLRFKPAFNPYTEPSMEVFGWNGKKWLEVGNSGMFRPEMLRPMGMPEDVRVIAWGLSLERPFMIKYQWPDIRALCGHKQDLTMIRNNPICRLDS